MAVNYLELWNTLIPNKYTMYHKENDKCNNFCFNEYLYNMFFLYN